MTKAKSRIMHSNTIIVAIKTIKVITVVLTGKERGGRRRGSEKWREGEGKGKGEGRGRRGGRGNTNYER